MPVRLLFHVVQEMRSLSNIIKSARIRSQSFLDLSQRLASESLKDDGMHYSEENQPISMDDETLDLIHKRKEELDLIEKEIQQKFQDADKKVEEMLAEAALKQQNMEEEAKDKEAKMLAEAHEKQNEVIEHAKKEADGIIEAAHAEKKALLQSVEGEVVETLITILQHIISEELSENVEWLRLVVRKMLHKEQFVEAIKLVVSPNCLQLIEKDKEHFFEGIPKEIVIESSDALNDTSCILETNQGNIEYDVNNGLNKMISEIKLLKELS